MNPQTPTSYEQLPPLSGVYLEDSYVLNVMTTEQSLTLDLDLVLTPDHPCYRDPLPTEQYCYRRGQIIVERARLVRWISRVLKPFHDASGEIDYGSIDSWSIDGAVSYVRGDFGEIEIEGGHVRLALRFDDEANEQTTRPYVERNSDGTPYRAETRTNGESGRKREYYEWDHTQGDIEVYDRRGEHLGTRDPVSGDMTKPPVPGRDIKKRL